MTQVISVYISKPFLGLYLTLEFGTTEVHDLCKTTIWIYRIKLLQLKIFDVPLFVPAYSKEPVVL